MRKNIKRLVAVLMVMAMIISMCSTAFAAGHGSKKSSQGSYKSYTKEVTEDTSVTDPVVEESAETTEDQAVDETAETTPEETVAEDATVTYPATEFDSDEIDGVTVHVDAPEGAFPEGTELSVKEVTDEEVFAAVESAAEGDIVKIVDVSFSDATGEIEPKTDIRVSITVDDVVKIEDPVVIHVNDELNAEVIDQVDEETADNEVVFENDEFSPIAVVDAATVDDTSNIVIQTLSAMNAKAPAEIAASKNLKDNGDGTQKLSLSVTGASESEEQTTVNKSNVVVVIDVSGSMGSQYGDFSEDQYVPYTYDSASYSGDERYYGYVNGNLTRIYRNNSNTGWVYYSGYSSYNYTGQAYWRVGYRLKATKAAAYELIDALLANNKDQEGLRDIMEISLVKFARKTGNNSNNGTQVLVSKSTSASTLKQAVKNLWAGGGTNWESAMQTAKTEADKISSEGESTSVIFLTDGKPTLYANDSGNGQEDNANVRTSWNGARDDGRAIVSAGYDLYNIFAYGEGSSYLKSFTNYAYRGEGDYDTTGDYTYSDGTKTSDHFFDAQDTEALIEAFKAIIDKINNKVGFAGVDVEDGVTMGVTNTSVVVDGTVHEGSFTYTVSNKSGTVYTVKIEDGKATFNVGGTEYVDDSAETVTTKIDPNDSSTWIESKVYSVTVGDTTYEMSPATINKDTGLIDWDLAGLGILEDGYTYTLDFDVWPNQMAYDLMADLNNGVTTLAEAEQTIVDSKGQEAWDEIADSIVVTFTDGTSKVISDLTDAEKAAIADGTHKCSYAIYTNWKQEVSYYTAEEIKNEAGEVISTEYTQQPTKQLTRPNAIALTSSTMDLRKLWADELDSSQLQRLLYRDGQPTKYKVDLKVWKADTLADLEAMVEADGDDCYKPVTLGWNETEQDYIWDEALDVAPGIMLDEAKLTAKGLDPADYDSVTYNGTKYYILESGHYYTVSEVTTDYHFDLVTIVYHPMIVNGELSNVTFKEDGTVENIAAMSTVDATNTLRGGINLKKIVLDPDGNEYPTDDEFTFTVVLNNEDGAFVGDNIPWYGVNGMYYHDADGNYIAESATGDQDGDGLADDGNIPSVTNNGKTATYSVTIDSTDNVRINNVPIGTTYTVTETQIDGFTLDSVVNEVGYDAPVYDEDGNPVYDEDGNPVTERVTDSTETTTELSVTGEIAPNRENNITFKNKMDAFPAFYVYHSSDNTIEKVFVDDVRVTRNQDETTGLSTYTFNIANDTKTGYLYGGYFKAYGGQKLTSDQIKALTYETEGSSGGVYGNVVTTKNWASDSNGTKYTGSAATAWKSANAYTKEKGTAITPVIDEVYYLKEVPKEYISPYIYYVYDEYSPNHELKKLYMITDTDDKNYTEVGIQCQKTTDDKSTTTLYSSIRVTKQGQETVYDTLTAKNLSNNKVTEFGSVPRGYLAYWETNSLIKANAEYKMLPYWKTLDGVTVTGISDRTVSIGNATYGTGGLSVSTTSVDSTAK